MPPRKKAPPKTPSAASPQSGRPRSASLNKVPVNIAVERKLIDSKISLPESPAATRMMKVVTFAIAFGVLAAASAILYQRIMLAEPTGPADLPRISVPETNNPGTEPEPTPTTTPETPPLEPVRVVEILDTPTGFLNVRTGPGTSFAKITEAKPGEAYILVSTDEQKGWYEIRLADGTTGWVTKQYASVK